MDIAHAPAEETRTSKPGAGWFTDSWGVHPLNVAFVVTVDLLLTGYELAAGGGLIVVLSLLVAITLVVPCAMVQKHAFADPWGVALAKGVMLALLTGIQGPVASLVTIALGVMGALALRRRGQALDVLGLEK